MKKYVSFTLSLVFIITFIASSFVLTNAEIKTGPPTIISKTVIKNVPKVIKKYYAVIKTEKPKIIYRKVNHFKNAVS